MLIHFHTLYKSYNDSLLTSCHPLASQVPMGQKVQTFVRIRLPYKRPKVERLGFDQVYDQGMFLNTTPGDEASFLASQMSTHDPQSLGFRL